MINKKNHHLNEDSRTKRKRYDGFRDTTENIELTKKKTKNNNKSHFVCKTK